MAITWNGGCGSGGGGPYLPGEGIDITGNVISADMNATNTFTKAEVEALIAALESIYATKVEATYTAGDGLVLTDKQFAVSVKRLGSGTDANRLPAQERFRIEEFPNTNANLPTSHWYQIYEAHSTDANYGTQLALGMTTDAAYYRKFSAGSWGPWRRLDVEYGVASTSANGLMAAGDKSKLNGISAGANKTEFTVVSGTQTYTPDTTATFARVVVPVNIPAGYTALGVVGAATGDPGLMMYTFLLSGSNVWIDYKMESSRPQGTRTASVRVLCVKNS